MRALIAKILRSVARFLWVPVEILVNGIKQVVMQMVPQRPTDLDNAAADVVAEDVVPGPAPAAAPAALHASRSKGEQSEADRVRRAARCLVNGQSIGSDLLDPTLGRDAQVLEWLAMLSERELSMLASVPLKRIEEHLEGGGHPLPMLRVSQVAAKKQAARRLKGPAMTPAEWKAWMLKQGMTEEKTAGQLELHALRLSRRGWNEEHLRAHLKTTQDAA